MTETLDTYTAGTSPEDFAQSDLPGDIDEDEPDGTEDQPLKWGTTVDPKTGIERPKKAPGRPRKMPAAEELAAMAELQREPDKPPQRPPGHKPTSVIPPEGDELKMPRAGVIAKSVNKAYRRAGKLIRGMEHGDPMGVGQALIDCTKVDPDEPEDERDPTVGEAWENLARTNPRILKIMLRLVAGGAITDLVMAHSPVGVALIMKPAVQRFFPMGDIIDSMTEEDEDADEGTDMPAGLTRDDIQQMQDLTDSQMKDIARKAASGMGLHLSDADIERATKQAAAKLPAGLTRNQPKSKSRAQRTGAR